MILDASLGLHLASGRNFDIIKWENNHHFNIVQVTESKDENVFLDPISLNAREYFNAHLWLRCRLALVTAFGAQIRGIGIVKGTDASVAESAVLIDVRAGEGVLLGFLYYDIPIL